MNPRTIWFSFHSPKYAEGPLTNLPLAANSRCTGAGLNTGESDEIIEDPFEGWELVDIDCEGDPGIVITLIENGVSAHCQSQGFTTCTFTNRRVSTVPTLSEWGMISAAGGLALIGVFFAVRTVTRRKDALLGRCAIEVN